MERLTYRAQGNCGFVWATRCPGASAQDVIDRLAAYEDTGLGPDEITELMAAHGTAILWLSEYRSIGPAKHLLELAQAEKDGRLVALPCKVGDILYEVDLPEYGVITCKVLHVGTYNGPAAHVPGNAMVSAISVGIEVIEGHGKGSGYAFEAEDFGKTVFTSRDAAAAALKKREADNEAD